MDASLILYAEHEFNASTFAARVCAATLSDFYSAVTAAIGTLRGPLHGGANEAAMQLIERFDSPADATRAVKEMLARKEKIMGFGHAVYRISDPRNAVIKSWSKRLAEDAGDTVLYPVSEAIEELLRDEKKLFANLDFYSASAYHFLGVPTPLFTPIFVCARIAGWAAHIIEQRGNNRLIRPTADYVGAAPRPYVPIAREPEPRVNGRQRTLVRECLRGVARGARGVLVRGGARRRVVEALGARARRLARPVLPMVCRRRAQYLLQRGRSPRRCRARQPNGADLRQSGDRPSRALHVRRAPRGDGAACRCASSARRRPWRYGCDLHADGAASGARDARVRAARRDPFSGVRWLRRERARGAYR